MSKKLSDLVTALSARVVGPADVPIDDIVFDSRKVKPGALYVALRGVHHDGHAFIAQAIQSGAKAVVCEEPLSGASATQVVVPDSLKALAPLAVRFWNTPSHDLLTIGITGTNGKTTSTYLIESIFQRAGWPIGVLGTINYRFGAQSVPAPNTTPFASELQRFIAQIRDGGGRACVMEVSSHALALGRTEGVEFDVGIFTNLTQDHLDFHKTMDAYGEAKKNLMKALDPASTKRFARAAIVNMDDPYGASMRAASRVSVLTYSVTSKADIYPEQLVCDAAGSRFVLRGPKISVPVSLPLLGDYNVANALAAAGAAISQSIPTEKIVQGLQAIQGVPGRMERVDVGQSFTVVVDYAHTEDALRHVMQALRRLRPRRLITVFGCGGDRDRTKRPLMGQASAELSEEVFVTSDNPRSEDPERITLDVEVGLRRVRPDHYKIVIDREDAIAQAFAAAQPGDIVLIAGKGHETYQIVGDKTLPFDDREVARKLLRSVSGKRPA